MFVQTLIDQQYATVFILSRQKGLVAGTTTTKQVAQGRSTTWGRMDLSWRPILHIAPVECVKLENE